MQPLKPPVITLVTDFGDSDAYAGIMKGVILSLCPEARIVDLTHHVPPHNIRVGALILREAARSFPAGVIHIAVVDPGVGGARPAVLVQTAAAWFIGPDNGLLHPAATAAGVQRVIGLTDPAYHRVPTSLTFHGRDVFAPVAAHLAAGTEPGAFGPERGPLQPLDLPAVRREGGRLIGEVVHIDHFGNLITNIAESDLDGFHRPALSVSIAQCASLPVVSTYIDVTPGEPAALIGSWGQVEIAVREGNAATALGASLGSTVTVSER